MQILQHQKCECVTKYRVIIEDVNAHNLSQLYIIAGVTYCHNGTYIQLDTHCVKKQHESYKKPLIISINEQVVKIKSKKNDRKLIEDLKIYLYLANNNWNRVVIT